MPPRFDLPCDGYSLEELQGGLVYRGPQPAPRGFYVFGKTTLTFRNHAARTTLASPPALPGCGLPGTAGYVPPPRDPNDENKNTTSVFPRGFGEGDLRELYGVFDDGSLRRVVAK